MDVVVHLGLLPTNRPKLDRCKVTLSGSIRRVRIRRRRIAGRMRPASTGPTCDVCGSRWDGESTAPVGFFAVIAWSLQDRHANVWKRVQDCWNWTYEGAPADGSALETGDCSERVLCGGWGTTVRGSCVSRTSSVAPCKIGTTAAAFVMPERVPFVSLPHCLPARFIVIRFFA